MTNGPETFSIPSVEKFQTQILATMQADHGKSNFSTELKNMGNGRAEFGYLVEEEKQISWPFSERNKSIQGVLTAVNVVNHRLSTMAAGVYSVQNDVYSALVGSNAGQVYLLSGDRKNPTALDITDAATRAGITAAGLRLLQENIETDGEVDRVEQQQIIDLTNKAKQAATGLS